MLYLRRKSRALKRKYQNIFFVFGLAVLAVMVTQLNFAEVWAGLRRAGYWFFAVILLWVFLYMINTASWYIIIRSGSKERPPFSFLWLYRMTITGFALNYATPGGLMGGEPYRIMSLAPKIGTERASSSVILYVMTHIFSHFWFWLLSVVLFVLMRPIETYIAVILACVAAFSLLGLWFFMVGYRKGIAVRIMSLLGHVPVVKGWARRFIDKHREQLATIDKQIADLHRQNRRTFVSAVLLELLCRILSAAEIMFILLVITPLPTGDFSAVACQLSTLFLNSVMILAFTSLFANLLFFMPLQLGGREGGFLMSTAGLAMTAATGIFVALIVRIRELVWTAIGLLLIRVR